MSESWANTSTFSNPNHWCCSWPPSTNPDFALLTKLCRLQHQALLSFKQPRCSPKSGWSPSQRSPFPEIIKLWQRREKTVPTNSKLDRPARSSWNNNNMLFGLQCASVVTVPTFLYFVPIPWITESTILGTNFSTKENTKHAN